MSNSISLTASMRSNLLSLQNIAAQVDLTQNRLSTGLKVNSAIDNPSSYYTAVSLNNRASDLSALLDSMAQGIQTIKAATEGLEAGTKLLEQALAIASQVLSPSCLDTKPLDYYLEQGYKVIDASMDNATIEAFMVDGAKLVLAEDVTLDAGLNLTAANITINGNGHSLSYKGTDNLLNISGSHAAVTNIKLNYYNENGGSAIEVTGSADISFIEIEAQGNKVYGVHCGKGGKIELDNTLGINVSGQGAHNLVNGNAEIYDGRSNTQAIVDQLQGNGLAANSAYQFYAPGVSQNDELFGQGKWYLPSIGEFMDLYGTDTNAMTSGEGNSGAVGNNKEKINETLRKLADAGATTLNDAWYWTSSEYNMGSAFGFNMADGSRSYSYKAVGYNGIRCYRYLENLFDPSKDGPKVGDVMYSDLSYGFADNRDSGKTAVGVVTWVSEDGRSAKIINLQNLRFSSRDQLENFDAEHPYEGEFGSTLWTTDTDAKDNDINGITNYNFPALLEAVSSGGSITVSNTNLTDGSDKISLAKQSASYDEILSQYDSLIKDSSYKGIGLLLGQDLTMAFNENRSARLFVQGKDASAQALGMATVDWQNQGDVELSIQELTGALTQIRQMSSELGNYYSIITTRENFTQNLINVLTEGADKLTLADMNEESANMLALKTRQQLAGNSLSLASQASQSILKLF